MVDIGVPDERKTIDLVIEDRVYPTERFMVSQETGDIQANEPRKIVDIVSQTGVADMQFLHYGYGQFNPQGLQYIKTEPLGACVALTLWDPKNKVGLVAHFAITNNAAMGISEIFSEIKSKGFNLSDFEARLIGGGAAEYGANGDKPRSQWLVKNLFEGLVREDVHLVEVDLYGNAPRFIVLQLENGEVYDYPDNADSVHKNDHYIENKKLPFNTIPRRPMY